MSLDACLLSVWLVLAKPELSRKSEVVSVGMTSLQHGSARRGNVNAARTCLIAEESNDKIMDNSTYINKILSGPHEGSNSVADSKFLNASLGASVRKRLKRAGSHNQSRRKYSRHERGRSTGDQTSILDMA